MVLVTTMAIESADARAADRTETHCLTEVIGKLADGELLLSPLRCHDTLEQVAESPGVATVTLGVHFDGRNGTGSSITVVGSYCNGGYWNTGSTWANRISSSRNGCYRLRHYDYPNKGGTHTDTTGAGMTHNLPTFMDNRTESVAYLGS